MSFIHVNIDDAIKNQKETRAGFGAGLLELGKINKNVVALCADLAGSLRMDEFIKEYPTRFIQCGISEANMISMAAGLTIGGQIPYTGTFANFSTGRVYDQIRQSISYSGKNVKICASHAGLTLGEDGATHQMLEDIGMMRMLPGMSVIVPCDYEQTKAATIAIASYQGPVYLRFGRPKTPTLLSADIKFILGKAQIMRSGNNCTIVACGHMVWRSIVAAEVLAKEGIACEVINMHTIKPLDTDTLLGSISKTHCIVSAEEHQLFGGLGSAIAEYIVRHYPVPQEFVAVNDSFGESGTPDQLMTKYGLDTSNIIEAVKKVVSRKKN